MTLSVDQAMGQFWAEFVTRDRNAADSIPGSPDPEAYLTESRYLRIFAIDFYASMLFAGTPRKDATLDAFWGALRARPDWPTVDAALRKRLPIYTAAVKNNAEPGRHYWIGKAFAAFVHGGESSDVLLYLVGGEEFANIGQFVKGSDEEIRRRFANPTAGCASVILVALLGTGLVWLLL